MLTHEHGANVSEQKERKKQQRCNKVALLPNKLCENTHTHTIRASIKEHTTCKQIERGTPMNFINYNGNAASVRWILFTVDLCIQRRDKVV